MQYVLEIEGITKKYKEKTALKNVSVAIRYGEIFGIIGPNGSGKTTLLKCIAGFLKLNEGRIMTNPVRLHLGICLCQVYRSFNLFMYFRY